MDFYSEGGEAWGTLPSCMSKMSLSRILSRVQQVDALMHQRGMSVRLSKETYQLFHVTHSKDDWEWDAFLSSLIDELPGAVRTQKSFKAVFDYSEYRAGGVWDSSWVGHATQTLWEAKRTLSAASVANGGTYSVRLIEEACEYGGSGTQFPTISEELEFEGVLFHCDVEVLSPVASMCTASESFSLHRLLRLCLQHMGVMPFKSFLLHRVCRVLGAYHRRFGVCDSVGTIFLCFSYVYVAVENRGFVGGIDGLMLRDVKCMLSKDTIIDVANCKVWLPKACHSCEVKKVSKADRLNLRTHESELGMVDLQDMAVSSYSTYVHLMACLVKGMHLNTMSVGLLALDHFREENRRVMSLMLDVKEKMHLYHCEGHVWS